MVIEFHRKSQFHFSANICSTVWDSANKPICVRPASSAPSSRNDATNGPTSSEHSCSFLLSDPSVWNHLSPSCFLHGHDAPSQSHCIWSSDELCYASTGATNAKCQCSHDHESANQCTAATPRPISSKHGPAPHFTHSSFGQFRTSLSSRTRDPMATWRSGEAFAKIYCPTKGPWKEYVQG